MSAFVRGARNPFRNPLRTAVVVALLAVVIGVFAILVQGALSTREKLEALQAGVRTVIELREAGAFGTGGFGGDKPIGQRTSPWRGSMKSGASRTLATSRKWRSTFTRH